MSSFYIRPKYIAAVVVIYLLSAGQAFCEAQDARQRDYILTINTFTEGAPWSYSIISPVLRMAIQDNNTDMFVEHMNMLMTDDRTTLNAFRDSLFAKYNGHRPNMLLLLGNSALLLKDDIRKKWGDIPIVLCAEYDYAGPDEAYLQKRPVLPGERTPIATLADSYNLTMLQTPVYIEESIELMRKMLPEMNKLVFVADQVYTNQEHEREIKHILKTKHPDLKYRLLSAADINTDQLFDSLNAVDSRTTGVLFSSWFHKRNFAGNVILMTNPYKVMAGSNIPMFLLSTMPLGDGTMLGGYMYDKTSYDKKLTETLRKIRAGEQARNIPFYRGENPAPRFDYPLLQQKGISPDLCPEETIFLSKPPTFWEQYRYLVAVFLIVLTIVLLFLYQQIRIHVLSKLKTAQQKEIDSIAEYRNLFDNMPILYMKEEVITDRNGNPVETIYRDVNQYFEKSFFKKEKVIGRKASEVFPESMPEFLHFIKIAMAEKRMITFPYYFRKIDRFYDIVLNRSHQPGIIDVFCLDSTDLHKAQKKLRYTNHKLSMALDIANIVPWKWDLKKGTILCDVNRPIELSGDTNEVDEEQISVPDARYFAKICREDRERVRRAYEDLISGNSEKVKEEYRVITRTEDGLRTDWVEAQATVDMRDEEGQPLTLIGSSLVISERKKMEEDLISAKDRAEESNRLKSAFLANMSHEIRTPLNAIVGFSEILASTETEEEKQEYVSIIENNNNLLLQLIGDILDLSKIEAGTMEFIYTDIELNTLMKEAVEAARLRSSNENVELSFESALPVCHIRTEKNRLMQVLTNLLTNAQKFTEKGYIKVSYEIRGKQVYFSVADTGCGIPEEQRRNIFERFVKLNSFSQGTGLGLSICQTIVQHMGGEIGVNSETDKGSTFWFTLPYIPAEIKARPEKEFHPIQVARDKLKILIAEDNSSNYKLFESILKNDYNLLHAWDGKEAVDLFEEHRPQLVLMDLNMPVMDGYEATREIRKLSADIPIIAVTAFAFASDEQKVMENGFDGYMPKPIKAGQLKAQIAQILQKRMIFLY